MTQEKQSLAEGESLTEDALPENSAATPDGDSAPETQGEVGGGSAYVEASRFNGLMGRFNQEKARAARLEAELAELKNNRQEAKPVVAESDEVRQLLEELREERIENARLKVVRENPELTPLADLIVGSSPKEVEEMGRLIASRLKGTAPAAVQAAVSESVSEAATTPSSPAQAAIAEEAPVTGGGATVAPDTNPDERLKEALKKGKPGWSDYLQAKWDLAATRGQLDGLELQTT